jgi:tetratricopeptide (TPR) repeat protein
MSSGLCAESSDAAFDEANKLYEKGQFPAAASAYEKLIETGGESAALYFNLGNANLKCGRIGRAIATYRKAELLAPRDPDIRANLRYARNQVQGPTLVPPHWQKWISSFTLNEWAMLTVVAFWLLFIFLTLGQWRPAMKQPLRNSTLALGLSLLILSISLAASLKARHFTTIAVVITADATVHHGPLDESPSAFSTHDGAELRVLDRKDQWLEVTSGPQRTGWIKSDLVKLLP